MENQKVITIDVPCRNKIVFSSFDMLDETILNKPLLSLVATLKSIIPTSMLEPFIIKPCTIPKYLTNIELCCNHINYFIRITTTNASLSKLILDYFQTSIECCYLEINKHVYKHGLYKDIMSLEYNPLSFRQPDDSIREYMIPWLQHNLTCVDLLVLIGGECTLFGKILSSFTKKIVFLTDFQSIASDIKHNYKAPAVELINYKTWQLADSQYNYMKHTNIACVCNTGIKGIGTNLANELCKLKANTLYIISCNHDTWESDWIILQKKYTITTSLEIRTNYSVWIYMLSRI